MLLLPALLLPQLVFNQICHHPSLKVVSLRWPAALWVHPRQVQAHLCKRVRQRQLQKVVKMSKLILQCLSLRVLQLPEQVKLVKLNQGFSLQELPQLLFQSPPDLKWVQ